MIRSIDVLSRNFNVLQEKQKNLSANAANATTPGYKFQELMQRTMAPSDLFTHTDGPEVDRRQELGGFVFGNEIDEAVTNFQDGALQQTGLATDLAVQGDGFFAVQGPNGETLYTQNGRFTVDGAGQLVTQEGYPVMTTQPAGPFSAATTVDEFGFIDGTAARIVVTSFGENTDGLTAVGNGYFTGEGGQENAGLATIQQGYLETSNVEMVDVMVDMMQISREFEANQKVLHASDETLQKATNEIGKV
ncbi:flagellar hook-basal body protein [Atopococcus tabaci]|uniref:flagellar hook-basal body protein n=1 Tax=Atopococcus tabaci TaxID=269774 RepID=UPI0003FA9755|nr:flagellar hook-basal body complex protein [Atopococcus tabaci]